MGEGLVVRRGNGESRCQLEASRGVGVAADGGLVVEPIAPAKMLNSDGWVVGELVQELLGVSGVH